MVKVFIERGNISKDVEASSIKEIMNKLNINREVVIIVKNNEVVTEDTKIKDNDEIKFLSVISGG